MNRFASFCFILIALASSPPTSALSKRVALVVGIDSYEQVPALRKAVNDARAMETVLADIGFEVIRAENPNRRDFNRALSRFAGSLGPGDTALFFFAGHGVHIDGRNYLLPSDIPVAQAGQESFVAAEAIAADSILSNLRNRGVQISLMILDACRDNPFPREGTRSLGGTRGLARMAAPEGSFILYSAGVGQLALDGLNESDTHPNSVFTRELVPLIKTPGLPITQIARSVRQKVQKLARSASHEQRPAYYDDITSDFYFMPEGAKPIATVEQSAPENRETQPMALELSYWDSVKNSTNPLALRSYLKRFPKGAFVELAQLKLAELERAKRANGDRVGGGKSQDSLPPTTIARQERPRVERSIKPSFDCRKASLPAERTICRSRELADLDRELARAYKSARSRSNSAVSREIRNRQRAWLKARNGCKADRRCLRSRYRERINELR